MQPAERATEPRTGVQRMADTPQPVLRSTPGEAPARDAPTSPGAAGMRLGEWDLGAEIGRGAMGIVYRAKRARDSATAAVKVLSPRLAQEERFVERFEREATALSALEHPRIVRVLDRGVSDGLPWFAMELVDGMNLRERMRARKLDDAQLMRAISGACRALRYAHAQGVVHRDIKPENLLVDGAGEVKVADFGLARLFGERWVELSRLSVAGSAVGTPYYMAPELLKGASPDPRADLYSLGVILYEALTGDLPMGRVRAPREVRSSIDPRLDRLVMLLLEVDPARRPSSAEEVADLLSDMLSTPYVGPPESSTPPDNQETRAVRDRLQHSLRTRRIVRRWLVFLALGWIAGGFLALSQREGGIAAVCFVGCFGFLTIAAAARPKYMGARCPFCKGFHVRVVRTGLVSQHKHLQCDDCQGQFGGEPKQPGAKHLQMGAILFIGALLIIRMTTDKSESIWTAVGVAGAFTLVLLILRFGSRGDRR